MESLNLGTKIAKRKLGDWNPRITNKRDQNWENKLGGPELVGPKLKLSLMVI